MNKKLSNIILAIVFFVLPSTSTISAYFVDTCEKTNVFNINIPKKPPKMLRLNYDHCGKQIILQTLYLDKNNNFYLDKKLTIRVKNLKVNKLNYKTQKITNENLPKSLQEYFLVEENTGKHISLPTQDKLQGYYYDKDSKKIPFSDKLSSWNLDSYNNLNKYLNFEIIDVWAGFKKQPSHS